MSKTTSIKELFFSRDILVRTCKECDHFFNDKDWKEDNWNLEYITDYNIDFDNFKTMTSKGKIGVLIELSHEKCPEVKEKHPQRQDHTIYK